MLALLAAMGVILVVPSLLTYAVHAGGKAGGVLGLVCLVLPALTAVFWSSACVFKAFCGLLGRGVG